MRTPGKIDNPGKSIVTLIRDFIPSGTHEYSLSCYNSNSALQ